MGERVITPMKHSEPVVKHALAAALYAGPWAQWSTNRKLDSIFIMCYDVRIHWASSAWTAAHARYMHEAHANDICRISTELELYIATSFYQPVN
jgi:hypothetical protein